MDRESETVTSETGVSPDVGLRSGSRSIKNLPLPPNIKLKGNLKTNWEIFRQLWDSYELLTGLKQDDMQYRVATFITCIGPQALEIHHGLPFKTSAERNDMNVILKLWTEYCCGKTNVTYERFCFNRCNQSETESFDAYVVRLRKLASTCEYGNFLEDMLRDRIVCGIHDDVIRKELLQESKLTLESCIALIRSVEITSAQAKSMSRSSTCHSEVNYVRNSNFSAKQRTSKKSSSSSSNTQIQNCKFCGGTHPRSRSSCPASDKECQSCGKVGHFAIKCKFNNKSKVKSKVSVKELEPQSDSESDTDLEECSVLDLNSVNEVNAVNPTDGKIIAMMHLQKQSQPTAMQVDCGASCNVLPERHLPLGVKLCNTSKKLRMYSDHVVSVLGTCKLRVKNPKNGKRYLVPFYVVQGNRLPLLGSKAAQQMNLITVNNENIAADNNAKANVADAQIADTSSSQILNAQNIASGVNPKANVAHVHIADTSSSQILKDFQDVFNGRGCMPGEVSLQVDNSIHPVIAPPRRVPLTVQPKLKDELDRLEREQVLVKVQEPTDWCSSLVCVEKPNGKLRLCIDPQPLNVALKRPHYPLPVIEDILPDLDGVKIFSKVDLTEGFLQCQLDDQSSRLTTFHTPWGRYRYKRMPYGIKPAPELFQQKLTQCLEGLKGIYIIADDILITGRGQSLQEANIDHDNNLRALLKRCRDMNITLNRDKFQYKLDSISFFGHTLTPNGLQSDPTKVQAILDMPTPTTPAEVQRLIGMVKYLAKFVPHLSDLTEPLRKLTHKNHDWSWTPQCDKAFSDIKESLVKAPVLKYFDPQCQTEGQGDASDTGLGFALMQNGLPIMYASRAMTSAERNYAQIEKELLAQVYGLERNHYYTYGRHIILWTDHKPLVAISNKPLSAAPKRLQRLLIRLNQYNVEIRYKPGPELYLADTLSRAYIQGNSVVEQESETVHLAELAVSEKQLTDLQTATACDPTLQKVKEYIVSGWPDRSKVPPDVLPYFPYKHELSIQDNVVLKADRIVVPKLARSAIRKELHSAHLGLESTLRRARESVYWPAMNSELKDYLSKCDICNTFSCAQPKEPLIPHELPNRPWEKIAVDFLKVDSVDYMVTVDYYSDFFELDRMTSKDAPAVIKRLKRHFSRHGVPITLHSDNGPPFNSVAFADFASDYGFSTSTSSPEYPQSNGKAESAVKIAKNLIRKSNRDDRDINRALLAWRNTPTAGLASSPSQRIFGRRTRTPLPTKVSTLKPKITTNVVTRKENKRRTQKACYDRTAKPLSELKAGNIVRMKPSGRKQAWKKARVQQKVNTRSYQVQTEEGAQYIRNRRHLKLTNETFSLSEPTSIRRLKRTGDRESTQTAHTREGKTLSRTVNETLLPSRRSTRTKKKPSYLKDFVCN